MFSHLCRFCLKEFMNSSDIVPLFEPHNNILYYRICNELQLSMQEDDQLGCNICKICSENITKFHKFVLTYRECHKRLRDMLRKGTIVEDDLIECKPNIDCFIQDPVKSESRFDESITLIKSELEAIDTDTTKDTDTTSDPIAARWKCTKCSSSFRTRRLLADHRNSHPSKPFEKKALTGERLQQCSICCNSFPSRKLLEKHNRQHHLPRRQSLRESEAPNNEYECDTCSKRFDTKNKIRLHVITRVKDGRHKYLCVACGYQFLSKFGLAQHISAIHDKEQRFHCTKCDRRFAHKHNLKTHMNRHSGIRPYACTVCAKRFYDSSTLNVHRKSVHSHTNGYACSICSKTFNRNGNLKLHMVKTHQIQQPKMQGNVRRVIIKVK